MTGIDRSGECDRDDAQDICVDGCGPENEFLLHVADDPRRGDPGMDHGWAIIASTPLILTCGCALGERAPGSSLRRP